MTEKLGYIHGPSSSMRRTLDEEGSVSNEKEICESKHSMEGFVKVEIDGGFIWVKDTTVGGLTGEEGEGRELEYDADELKGDLDI